ncbi:Peroxisomal biogenesis factor [Lachnellula hyalina]|uniref:Peroxisomal biogenesis factor n=1 Tax=Lachnellula hyalina TaxID=1316788 RepID=A0A8H8R4F3_9HELO|nr:Peroxisomal biogenesis factor [Lachnellula hyalina]TVY26689.1 Peroxisomal biogenesis factor [Lachnellula hyalina]
MESKPEESEGLTESLSKASIAEETPTAKPEEPAGLTQTASTSVPDPEEDDLDDLDDMLDDFTPSKPDPAPPTKATTTAPSIPAPSEEIGISDEDFAKQLQAGMAELLGGLENSSEMPDMAALENIMKELGVGGASTLEEAAEPSPPSSSSAVEKDKQKDKGTDETAAATATEKSFQETIKETMARMKASDTQSTAASASAPDSSDDLVAEMLKAMQASGMEGEGSEEDFSKMLLGMMEQLTNKDILYEPMKELDDKFPAWMERNEGKVDEVDMKRYREQRGFVREIVGRFERTGYTDENVADREFIVERMQKMQAAGSPPPDLVGDMEAAQEAFGAPEEGCPQQ